MEEGIFMDGGGNFRVGDEQVVVQTFLNLPQVVL